MQAEYTHTGLYRCEAASVLGKAEASGTMSTINKFIVIVIGGVIVIVIVIVSVLGKA